MNYFGQVILETLENNQLESYFGNSERLFKSFKLEMEAEYLTKTLSYLNLNISTTKNGRNKL